MSDGSQKFTLGTDLTQSD